MNAKIIWKYQSAPLLSSSNEKNVKYEKSVFSPGIQWPTTHSWNLKVKKKQSDENDDVSCNPTAYTLSMTADNKWATLASISLRKNFFDLVRQSFFQPVLSGVVRAGGGGGEGKKINPIFKI
jgi:hypothetical protein